ncbi:hypothetical protein TUM4261_32080 [Shewanella sp. c952]|nr:hypothetical protein TUM4261_32080 [Shewanella sp. c952]
MATFINTIGYIVLVLEEKYASIICLWMTVQVAAMESTKVAKPFAHLEYHSVYHHSALTTLKYSLAGLEAYPKQRTIKRFFMMTQKQKELLTGHT